ncbi:hypothetical protein A3C59_01735 [Candidatus Daviesbacteria bacterium RIFCSPHIGHO2_02_FULL_36_13]|uniref:Thymidylate kinase n=1 Tax=Candidatus Daviesbacteria bacterium RIFCSPHIGHO2_02_FULL_36_13 TaxID=1797768 RepID=A0A1F5JW92_9BACT|nr:MAG: hypothetical protein A3C59_01735 [Candidatus Daviesbacteria bacterium RIFCSPHIGHO2_02_FULL_36_13]
MNRGKLVVLEGTDGSGKTTQINLLSQYLKQKNIDFEVVSFPQYGKNEYANYIYDYLSGKFGDINGVEVHKLAKAYADDRKTIRDQIEKWLSSGKLVIANRYVSSSKAHLSAHLEESEREEFINFIDSLEYKENNMPREDLTILLNVDSKVGQKNSQEKNHPDLHEDNLRHLETARQIFLDLAQKNNWKIINCMNNGEMRTPEGINKEIREIISSAGVQ